MVAEEEKGEQEVEVEAEGVVVNEVEKVVRV